MIRQRMLGLFATAIVALGGLSASAQDEAAPAPAAAPAEISFMKDVAPILREGCIACHNAKKAESKYLMTTFESLVKGGQNGEGFTVVPGDAEGSYLVELIQPDAAPRMPYKQDPMVEAKRKIITDWITQGAKYDGKDPKEDWVSLLNRSRTITIPESYPIAVPITALAYRPDGTEVVASGYHELTFWKTADGTLARRVQGQPERTYDVAYSPDGKWLATAGGDPGQFGLTRLYQVEEDGNLTPAKDLVESDDSQFAVAFSPDGALLATAGADRAIRIFKVEDGERIAQIEDHADWILDLAFSGDGKRLASASRDKTSKVFDVEKKEALVTFPGHGDSVNAVAFIPGGPLVATGGGDNRVRIWNPDDEAKQARELGGFGGAVFALRLTPDGQQLFACGADKLVRVFNPADGKAIRQLSGHKDWVYSIALSPDAKALASGSWDGDVMLWNVEDGAAVRTILAAPGLTPPAPAGDQAAAK